MSEASLGSSEKLFPNFKQTKPKYKAMVYSLTLPDLTLCIEILIFSITKLRRRRMTVVIISWIYLHYTSTYVLKNYNINLSLQEFPNLMHTKCFLKIV